jgi:DNA-binding transcriptional regulator YiaG
MKTLPVIRRSVPGRVRVHWPVRVLGIRMAMGLTQRQFANLVGVSVDTLQNWERTLRAMRTSKGRREAMRISNTFPPGSANPWRDEIGY